MLFMGDAGAQSEARLLTAGTDVAADVRKVGHHGSAYSSTPAFIAAVRPHYALISVGRHNLFGHPASATIATLQRLGATVYRTDHSGAITVRAGPGVAVEALLGPLPRLQRSGDGLGNGAPNSVVTKMISP
jgi:beta-lactamase superfamily II metal-dependent hydrolase